MPASKVPKPKSYFLKTSSVKVGRVLKSCLVPRFQPPSAHADPHQPGDTTASQGPTVSPIGDSHLGKEIPVHGTHPIVPSWVRKPRGVRCAQWGRVLFSSAFSIQHLETSNWCRLRRHPIWGAVQDQTEVTKDSPGSQVSWFSAWPFSLNVLLLPCSLRAFPNDKNAIDTGLSTV